MVVVYHNIAFRGQEEIVCAGCDAYISHYECRTVVASITPCLFSLPGTVLAVPACNASIAAISSASPVRWYIFVSVVI